MAVACYFLSNFKVLGSTCVFKPIQVVQASFSTSHSRFHINQWRKDRGLEWKHTAYGPLTNRPDYSFRDGRAVPLGVNMKRRMDKQMEYAEKIVTLSKEVDMALEMYNARMEQKEVYKQTTVANKLKAKGDALHERRRSRISKNQDVK